jgi:hypothetical protein
VAVGGTLILSGILAPECERVMPAYTKPAPALRGGAPSTELQAVGASQLGDWVALVLRRGEGPRRDG